MGELWKGCKIVFEKKFKKKIKNKIKSYELKVRKLRLFKVKKSRIQRNKPLNTTKASS
jgi:hypothetical protein